MVSVILPCSSLLIQIKRNCVASFLTSVFFIVRIITGKLLVISVTKSEYRAYLSVHMLVEITEIIFPEPELFNVLK